MKILKRAVCAALCLLVLPALFSCGKKEYAMRLENTSFSGRIYGYYLACYKQYWLTYFGQTDDEKFWSSVSEGETNAKRLTDISEQAVEKRLICTHLFDLYGLKLSESENNSISRMIAAMKDAAPGNNGIKDDEVFRSLGLDESDLKKILVIDSKTAAFQDYLFGEDGVRKITDEDRERYYLENYYRFRLLFLMNCDFARDGEGNIVYNESGSAAVKEISDERYEEKLDLAKDILEKVRGGDGLQKYIDEYSEELEKDDYKNGRYICSVNEYGPLISAAVMKLSEGEAGLLQTPTGIYVLQREEPDPGAWNNKENEAGGDFYNFELMVTENAFDEYLSPFYEKISVDRSVTEKYKMEELPYTFSWQYLF